MGPLPPTTDLDAIIERAEPLFKRLEGSRLFLTGGTGFFGRWLLESLHHAEQRLTLNLDITVLSRNPGDFLRSAPHLAAWNRLSWLCGDIRNFQTPPGSFHFIIHAATAASAHLNQSKPAEMYDTIVQGMENILELCVPGTTEGMLLTSSGAVNGPQPASLETMGEDDMRPDAVLSSAYAQGKRRAEAMATDSGLPIKIARGFAFVGPHMSFDSHFAVGNFIRDACAGGPISITGDGTPLRSYLYASDLVIWLLKILMDGKPARPYNVGSDLPVSIADLAHQIAHWARDCPIQIHGTSSGLPPERYIPSIERARSELDLHVWTPLPKAIQRTLDWYRESLH